MNLGARLSAWAALAALLAAAGVFIDKYHLKGKKLERLRFILIALWIKLNDNTAPFLSFFGLVESPTAILKTSLSNDKPSIVCRAEEFNLMAAQALRSKKREDLLIRGWTIISMACGVAAAIYKLFFDSYIEDLSLITRIFIALVSGLGVFISTFVTPFLLCFIFIGVPMLVVVGVVYGLRRFGLITLEAASAPEATPCAYFGALIGLVGGMIALIGKFL